MLRGCIRLPGQSLRLRQGTRSRARLQAHRTLNFESCRGDGGAWDLGFGADAEQLGGLGFKVAGGALATSAEAAGRVGVNRPQAASAGNRRCNGNRRRGRRHRGSNNRRGCGGSHAARRGGYLCKLLLTSVIISLLAELLFRLDLGGAQPCRQSPMELKFSPLPLLLGQLRLQLSPCFCGLLVACKLSLDLLNRLLLGIAAGHADR